MEYTKGEWAIKENDIGLLSIPIEDGLVISATRPAHQVGLTPEQANLIASAPDLYEALKLLRGYSEMVDNALAKVEGK